MRIVVTMVSLACMLSAAALASAQPPSGGKQGASKPSDANGLVARMMAFDKNGDGKLTRDEITDERLLRLFERADANKDGMVTKEELETLAAQEERGAGRQGQGGPGGRGPGGPGGGPGGPGGRGPGGFGQPQPGQILPGFLQDQLKLTPEQKKQLDELQKEVDAKLNKLLTEEQRKQLKELRDRGPGGFGPPGAGGPPGRGGPGGPPPDRPTQ